jgi:CheY-like chemotaxis protein
MSIQADDNTPVSSRTSRSARPLRILVVEDVEVNQRLVATVLQRHGHSVEVAANGRLAVEELKKNHYDLVLMDVQMPEMDGLEATETIRRHETKTGGHVTIVAMTAHAMKGDRERCLASGMDSYISKPVRAGELLALIESMPKSEPAYSRV